jgi:hypothetical protein
MNKEDFLEILEASILSFDGVSEITLIKSFQINPKFAKIGVKLCSFLQDKF